MCLRVSLHSNWLPAHLFLPNTGYRMNYRTMIPAGTRKVPCKNTSYYFTVTPIVQVYTHTVSVGLVLLHHRSTWHKYQSHISPSKREMASQESVLFWHTITTIQIEQRVVKDYILHYLVRWERSRPQECLYNASAPSPVLVRHLLLICTSGRKTVTCLMRNHT